MVLAGGDGRDVPEAKAFPVAVQVGLNAVVAAVGPPDAPVLGHHRAD